MANIRRAHIARAAEELWGKGAWTAGYAKMRCRCTGIVGSGQELQATELGGARGSRGVRQVLRLAGVILRSEGWGWREMLGLWFRGKGLGWRDRDVGWGQRRGPWLWAKTRAWVYAAGWITEAVSV